ncbi:MAG: hypothetical protein JG774_247 [Desulfomicrobiaceae bacterium]|jgi:hypothetical protein|nr:hypothetical protein [Desulfomicrobiaceae bacterium]
MGRTLTIRVQASTYSEDEVRRRWPRLWNLAFEEHQPAFPCPMRGVLELVQALDDLRHFGRWDAGSSDVAAVLQKGVPAAVAARRNLEDALSRWDVHAALAATDAVEDALDLLERQMPPMA